MLKQIRKCRLCSQGFFSTVLDLGEQKIAGDFSESPLKRAVPLKLVECLECHLVQLQHTVDRRLLFGEGYGYRSGGNEAMVAHLEEVARYCEGVVGCGKKGMTIIDIGANDGALLNKFSCNWYQRIGFEPSNIQRTGDEFGSTVGDIPRLWFSEPFRYLEYLPKASIITSIAMFYDVDDPCGFAWDIRECLAEDGIWVSEQTYLPYMLERNLYDGICHEHLTYWSLETFERLLDGCGLRLIDVDTNDINGGSFRTTAVKRESDRQPSPEARTRMDSLRRLEFEMELDGPGLYMAFAERVERLREDLIKTLLDIPAKKHVIGYGASTKGNVILQFCRLKPISISAIADRNPGKWAKQVPTGQWIISEESARQEADYFLILPHAFLDAFIERERAFLERGGKFIVPLPEVKILGKEELIAEGRWKEALVGAG